MKKFLILLLTFSLYGAWSSALPVSQGRPSHRGKAVPDITAAADFKAAKPVKHRAVTRQTSLQSPLTTGLYGNSGLPVVKAPKATTAPVMKNASLTSGLELRGSVVATWSFMNFPGLYMVPTTADGGFGLITNDIIAEYGGYDDGNGNFYVAGMIDYGMGMAIPYCDIFNTSTWEYAGEVPTADFSIICSDNAVDPTSGIVYGCYMDAEGGTINWAKANYAEGTSESVKVLSDDQKMWGVACDKSGQFYAILENGILVKVNKATGDLTEIGDTGLRPYYTSSAAFDDKAGKIIFAYSPVTGTGSLWAIDPATAAAEVVVDFPDNEQITCLTVMGSGAEAGAPAEPAFTVTTALGDLVADFTLTMPSINIDGSAASASMGYSILIDGVSETEGTAAPGETVNGQIAVATEGLHVFTAFASNELGQGAKTQVELFVGQGVPMFPANFKATDNSDGSITLTWDAVTTSADGGYLDPAKVTYEVNLNEEPVATGLTETTYKYTPEAVDGFVKLKFGVVAVNNDKKSVNSFCETGAGSITPPYACAFGQTPDDSGLYTTFNLNGDYSYWYYTPYYQCFKVDYVDEGANDDWLITPGFYLESGKNYEFSFRIAAGSEMYKERYSLHMGTTLSPDAMTTELIAEEELTNSPETPLTKTVRISPETTGRYFIGFHAVSPAPCFMIRVDEIAMSAPLSTTSPAEVTQIELTPDTDGHLRVEGTFAAPAVDVSGEPLTTPCAITVTRQGKDEPVAEIASAAPGSIQSFTDTDIPEAGTYTYEFTTRSISGDFGRTVKASVHVGPVAPGPVSAIKVIETETPGTVKLTWNAPTATIEGKPLKAENVTYMVYSLNADNTLAELLTEPISATETTIKVCEPDEAAFAILYVESRNLGLESLEIPHCDMTPVGKAAAAPYSQSYNSGDRQKNIVGIYSPVGSYSQWTVGNLESTGIKAQDGDDAFLYLDCPTQYSTPAFYTGKISLTTVENPALTFYHYVLSDNDANTFEVLAVTTDGVEHSLGVVDHAATGFASGWNLAHFSLADYKDQTVYIIVRTTIVSHYNMAFDNLKVADMHPVDLAATRIVVPARVELNTPFTLTATIANLGSTAAEGYEVKLLVNGTEVATVAPETRLAPGEESSVEFGHVLDPLTKEAPVFTSSVTLAGDADETNNLTPEATAELKLPRWPVATGLAYSQNENGVTITWDAPSTAGFDAKPVEDFENATAWVDEAEGWTLLDVDRQQIGQLDAIGVPDAIAMRTLHSFFIFDNESDDIFFYNPALQPLFGAHSGSKSLAAIYTLSYSVPQDDWAISPKLSGEAQTVSFYARSYHPDYLDHMEVLYSTKNSTDPADFETLCPEGIIEVPQLTDALGNAAYTLYEFSLPAGALRFAIRACNPAGEGYMLMIDDVRMNVADATLQVAGYDLFRDGEKVNSSLIESPAFTDTSVPEGTHVYNVVVNYNRGVSAASDDLTVGVVSGLESIAAENTVVKVVGHTIIVSGVPSATMVNIYATDGRTIAAHRGDLKIDVETGVYLVTIGSKTVKLIVR